MAKRCERLRGSEVVTDRRVGAELLLLLSAVLSEGNDGAPEEFELFGNVGSVSFAQRSVGFEKKIVVFEQVDESAEKLEF